MTSPVFVVVGHPNKGKSSIVSTLAHDDSVRIGPEPGTTVHIRRYPMRVDGESLYTLVDTPGFQRARRALHILKQREMTAAQRPGLVRAFVEEQRAAGGFPDECELLGPIVEGGGILYVVDGSVPYGPEYEAEMEILRWTGQPSMALINPIGGESHIEEWRTALGQFFKIVVVFNAVTADFGKQLRLLQAFGELKEEWRGPLARAVASLGAARERQQSRAARAIASMLTDMLTLEVGRRLGLDDDPGPFKPALEKEYRERMCERERRGRDEVEAAYGHGSIQRHEEEADPHSGDLFSEESWWLWGLTTRQLLVAGAAGGAAIGGGIDLAVGGASLLVGSAIGAAAGGAAAWFSRHTLARFRILNMPLGGRRLRYGPSTNAVLPYVILGRALHHHELVSTRAHAERHELALNYINEPDKGESWMERLPSDIARGLRGAIERLRRGRGEVESAEIVASRLADLFRRSE